MAGSPCILFKFGKISHCIFAGFIIYLLSKNLDKFGFLWKDVDDIVWNVYGYRN